MIICAWNVRGCNKPLKGAWIAQFAKDHNVAILGLLETRFTIGNLKKFMRSRFGSWKFVHNFETIVNGRIALLWDPNKVDCSNFDISEQCINSLVGCRVSQQSFQCTVAYGLHSVVKRRKLWDKLMEVTPPNGTPWIILGDFNVVKAVDEKIGGRTPTVYDMQDFDSCCSTIGVFDCPSSGEFFTWTNGWMKAVLDRVLINQSWHDNNLACHSTINKMDCVSDHCPLLVDVFDRVRKGNKCFKFFNMWIQHPAFHSIVDSTWSHFVRGTKQFVLTTKLKALKGPLKNLNIKDFSHISSRAKQANLDFQQALHHLDVTTAGDPERANLKLLREKAMFFSEAERQFFCQKLKTNHLIGADRGSKYFHSLIKNKNRTHSINRVIDESGQSTTSLEQVSSAFVAYFSSLFGEDVDRIHCNGDIVTNGICITHEQGDALVAPVSDSEIKQAIFDMGDNKAPGPDGFSVAFFKSSWDIVGRTVCTAVREFFTHGKLLKEWNHTAIALIPKCANAKLVTDYRPISCCNVPYKIITKIIASRLAVVLPDIIDHAQSAFIEGRSMSDNIFLAQELIRGYCRKRTGMRCMIMVDLRKAYDTISWQFLREMLSHLQFPPAFIGWIMKCVSTSSFSVAINGVLNGHFQGKRGIRQGDPMSPMLFTICLEYFSRLIDKRTRFSGFSFHPRCKELRISHLAYADDLMLFSRGDTRSVSILMNTLKEFEATFGLSVNINKSHIYTAGVHDNRLDFAGLPYGSLPVRYLGIPLHAKKLSGDQFSPLIRSITLLIDDWKGHTLSYAGRLELLRSVVQGFVSFWLQHFHIPEIIINRNNSLCREFLCGKKRSMVAWNIICLPKDEGGLGLHNFKYWNFAFLAKNLWNFHAKKDSLWVKWVNHIYIPSHNIWEWRPNEKHSPLIKSIFGVRNLLCSTFGTVDNTVTTLSKWVVNGSFSTSMVYEAIRPHGSPSKEFRGIWKGFIPPKHSFIAWLAVRNRLPTKDKLLGFLGDDRCPFCNVCPESTNHLFFSCRMPYQVWEKVSTWSGCDKRTTAIKSSLKWINRTHRGTRLKSKGIRLSLLATIYHVWIARNNFVFNSVPLDRDSLVLRIEKDVCRVLYGLYPSFFAFE